MRDSLSSIHVNCFDWTFHFILIVSNTPTFVWLLNPLGYLYLKIDIQDPRFGHCGQYQLSYMQHRKEAGFYELFKKYASNPIIFN